MVNTTIKARIEQIKYECEGIISLELIPVNQNSFPSFSAGSHIDIKLPNGHTRSYSLTNAPNQYDRYNIAVKLEEDSKGGSAWFHHEARVGMEIQTLPPSNDFEMVPSDKMTVLFAAGIGITPILSMIAKLNSENHAWTLHYSAKTKRQRAFFPLLEKLRENSNGQIHYYLTAEESSRMDLQAIMQASPEGTHFYCCGPASFINVFIEAGQNHPAENIHFERFSASQEAATDGGYNIHLARDGRTLPVEAGQSILDVLLDSGIDVQYACSEGVCGTCKTTVLDGIPDHRDDCLSDEEKAQNKAIMVCCSGSLSKTLTLDL